nr:hypothetical protein [Tanacetum cinerariifolium]
GARPVLLSQTRTTLNVREDKSKTKGQYGDPVKQKPRWGFDPGKLLYYVPVSLIQLPFDLSNGNLELVASCRDNLFLERLLHDDPIPLLDILDFSNAVRVFLPFFTYPVKRLKTEKRVFSGSFRSRVLNIQEEDEVANISRACHWKEHEITVPTVLSSLIGLDRDHLYGSERPILIKRLKFNVS